MSSVQLTVTADASQALTELNRLRAALATPAFSADERIFLAVLHFAGLGSLAGYFTLGAIPTYLPLALNLASIVLTGMLLILRGGWRNPLTSAGLSADVALLRSAVPEVGALISEGEAAVKKAKAPVVPAPVASGALTEATPPPS